MAHKIQIKRGSKADLPVLNDGEMGLCIDTQEVFVGSNGTNIPVSYAHPTTAGNKHIPTGGASGQVLKYSASGTAVWGADNDTITTVNGKTGAITKADITALGIPAQDTVYSHPATHPASMITGLPASLPASGGNADTVGGFTVGVSVPAGAVFTDTVYSHPTSHPASMITGLPTKLSELQTALDGKVDDSQVLTKVPVGAVFTDTIYTHPESHPASIIMQDTNNRFVTDAEKTRWNGKANAPTAATATLSTTWTGSGPYTQNITVSGVTSTNNITVSLASTANEAQRKVARDALLSATAQAANSITITADGDKPTVTLPIQVLILGG